MPTDTDLLIRISSAYEKPRVEPITHYWLRSRGFRLDHHNLGPNAHMIRYYDASNCHLLEVAEGRREDGWFCWLRDDMSHCKARFIHCREIRTSEQMERLWLGLTDKPLEIEEFDRNQFHCALEREQAQARLRWLDYTLGERFARHS